MIFFDKKERQESEEAYLIRKQKDVEKLGYIEIIRDLPQTQGSCFCKGLIKHVQTGEAIFDKDGYYITYRVE